MTHFLFLFFLSIDISLAVQITTPSGQLRGKIDVVDGRNVLRFLNIPYGKAPTGEKRFTAPEAYGKWQGERDATKFGNICPQSSGVDMASDIVDASRVPSEDCLFLNIYLADTVVTNANKTVMLWIYGGGFVLGESSAYDGSYLALYGDVIVVTINYRVGAFGFFSTLDKASPGNYGLLDQILAMTWVQQNIRSFGGDPSSVTIFGESAGGLSVSHHLLNTATRGLFKRGIIHSGANFGDTEMCRNVRESALKLGILIGCLNSSTTLHQMNTTQLVQCLRTKSIEELINAQNSVLSGIIIANEVNCFTGTVVDGTVISRHPRNILKEANSPQYNYFRSIDIMAGTTNLEGVIFSYVVDILQYSHSFNQSEGIPASVACDIIIPMFNLHSQGNVDGRDAVNAELCKRIASVTDKIKTGRNVYDFMGDVYFVLPAVKLLEAHAKGPNTASSYHFLFSLEGLYDMYAVRPYWLRGYGSEHGTDEIIPFGPLGLAKTFQDAFRNISIFRKEMIQYWTNFAKTGYASLDFYLNC